MLNHEETSYTPLFVLTIEKEKIEKSPIQILGSKELLNGETRFLVITLDGKFVANAIEVPSLSEQPESKLFLASEYRDIEKGNEHDLRQIFLDLGFHESGAIEHIREMVQYRHQQHLRAIGLRYTEKREKLEKKKERAEARKQTTTKQKVTSFFKKAWAEKPQFFKNKSDTPETATA